MFSLHSTLSPPHASWPSHLSYTKKAEIKLFPYKIMIAINSNSFITKETTIKDRPPDRRTVKLENFHDMKLRGEKHIQKAVFSQEIICYNIYITLLK